MTYHRIAGRTLREIDGSGDGLRANQARVLFALHESAHAIAATVLGVPVERIELPREGGHRDGDRTVYGTTTYAARPSDAHALIIALAGTFGEELAHPDVRAGIPTVRAEDEQAVAGVLARYGAANRARHRKDAELAARAIVDRHKDRIDGLAFALLQRGSIDGSWVRAAAR